MLRQHKNDYYLNIAKACAMRGTCIRRNYGAIIVKNDAIVSTGYTGSPRGTVNCCDVGICKREELKIPSGQQYDLCRSVHAEMNAIIKAGRNAEGAILYLAGIDAKTGLEIYPSPCYLCKRMIINAGITDVYYYNNDKSLHIVSVDELRSSV